MCNRVIQITGMVALAIGGSSMALAQYGGGPMGGGTGSIYTAPKGGYGGHGAAIGIGVGAAAGVGAAYWVLHHRPNMVGCVQHSGRGNAILNEKDGKLYQLLPASDVSVKSGERVALQGKKSEEYSGKYSFFAKRVVKDYGACEASKATASVSGAN